MTSSSGFPSPQPKSPDAQIGIDSFSKPPDTPKVPNNNASSDNVSSKTDKMRGNNLTDITTHTPASIKRDMTTETAFSSDPTTSKVQQAASTTPLSSAIPKTDIIKTNPNIQEVLAQLDEASREQMVKKFLSIDTSEHNEMAEALKPFLSTLKTPSDVNQCFDAIAKIEPSMRVDVCKTVSLLDDSSYRNIKYYASVKKHKFPKTSMHEYADLARSLSTCCADADEDTKAKIFNSFFQNPLNDPQPYQITFILNIEKLIHIAKLIHNACGKYPSQTDIICFVLQLNTAQDVDTTLLCKTIESFYTNIQPLISGDQFKEKIVQTYFNSYVKMQPYLLTFFELIKDEQVLSKIADCLKEGIALSSILNDIRNMICYLETPPLKSSKPTVVINKSDPAFDAELEEKNGYSWKLEQAIKQDGQYLNQYRNIFPDGPYSFESMELYRNNYPAVERFAFALNELEHPTPNNSSNTRNLFDTIVARKYPNRTENNYEDALHHDELFKFYEKLDIKFSDGVLQLPDPGHILKKLNELRTNEYPKLPELKIKEESGIATDLDFIKFFRDGYDVVLSTGKEFVHDCTIHLLPALNTLYRARNGGSDLTNRRNNIKHLIGDLCERIEHAERSNYDAKNLELIKFFLGYFVDVVSSLTDVDSWGFLTRVNSLYGDTHFESDEFTNFLQRRNLFPLPPKEEIIRIYNDLQRINLTQSNTRPDSK